MKIVLKGIYFHHMLCTADAPYVQMAFRNAIKTAKGLELIKEAVCGVGNKAAGLLDGFRKTYDYQQ